jgi:2-polyprenyl-6-methoxyphenol hydroxylase-like FAD-dependent oxidoreductase
MRRRRRAGTVRRMSQPFDAIVVGARCAGAPTAMLLAQRGHRVLLVDRATFPSDTLSTHIVHAPGVAALDRWGLLDAVRAGGCPPFDTYTFDFGPFAISGSPRPYDGASQAIAPRRTVLDEVLVRAAARAGAQVRERFRVDELLFDGDRVTGIRGRDGAGRPVVEHARVVIGADGRSSPIAKAVGAEAYYEKPRLQWAYYSYWSDLPVDGMETVIRPDRGWGAAPTDDGLTMLVVGWPFAEAAAYKADIEANYLRTLDLAPAFADRVRHATREERFAGGAVRNLFRKPFGPGWALVGDAGYNKDPITAQGISDAFRDAELLTAALHATLAEGRPYEDALSAYQAARDARALPIYEFTTQMATLAPPPPELQQVLAAVAGDREASDDFASVVAGTLSPLAFFDPANLGRILGAGAPA